MNPYEEPQAELQTPDEVEIDSEDINWGAILWAGGIYVAISSIAVTLLRIAVIDFDGVPQPPGLAVLALIPWVLAAAFLGVRINYRWISHGLIYSVIPTITYVLNIAFKRLPFYPDSFLEQILYWQMASMATTLITMAAIRLLLSKPFQL